MNVYPSFLMITGTNFIEYGDSVIIDWTLGNRLNFGKLSFCFLGIFIIKNTHRTVFRKFRIFFVENLNEGNTHVSPEQYKEYIIRMKQLLTYTHQEEVLKS